MYLSLPLCRILTTKELAAILGHELGHFVGEDTVWSRKFYPIYRGSIETIDILYSSSANGNSLTFLAFLPALYFMKFFICSFENAEKEIGRQRELSADDIGVKITSAEIMARGLLKVHISPYAWKITLQEMNKALSAEKQIVNISTFFYSACKLIPENFMKDVIGKTSTLHPTDTHPTLSLRLKNIGIELSELYYDTLKPPTVDIAIELIDNPTNIEEELSELEHYRLIQSGAIKPIGLYRQAHENGNNNLHRSG